MKNILFIKLIKERKGFALAYILVIVGAVIGIGSTFLLFNLSENKQAALHLQNLTSYYSAQSGADIAYLAFKNYINHINEEIAENRRWSDIRTVNNYLEFFEMGPLGSPAQTNEIIFHLNLSPNNDYYLTYSSAPILNNLGNGTSFQASIALEPLGDATYIQEGSEEAIIYLFKYLISSYGRDIGAVSGKNTITGEGVVSVKFIPGSYGRFALFTDSNKDGGSNQDVWFNEDTKFTGPVYTNGQFNFWKFPIFQGRVYSKSQTAKFYNNGSHITRDANNNSTIDVPIFTDGFKRGVAGEVLPDTLLDLRKYNLQNHVTNPPKNHAYFFPANANNKLSGGLYIPGSVEEITFKAEGNKQIVNVVYDYWPLTNIKMKAHDFIFDYDKNTTTVKDPLNNNKVIETIYSLPNGTILVDGNINSFGGTIQKNSCLTLAAKNDITITNHIKYEEDPRIFPQTKNILGILSEKGSVIIAHGFNIIYNNAPNNLVIHGTIMTPKGSLHVRNYTTIGANKGTLTLLGGLISKYYGALARTDNITKIRYGYGRDFIYDERMADASRMPLGFPKTESLQYDTTREGKEDTLDLIVWRKKVTN